MKEPLEQNSRSKASRQAKDLLRIRLEEKGKFGKRKDKAKLEEGQAIIGAKASLSRQMGEKGCFSKYKDKASCHFDQASHDKSF